ncbi:PPK2 family polyphosphate kinase [Jiangella alba]|uniref:Polyphosphate:nucleotide phosphotransferase, PPK2 family n=1 Tax=Jiangella alba TaxID=561176 RepID=A0A1H5MR84_9ACTN|nr:PPK2 family polyphosphate kinase [Jiangella alba]SEE91743.1 polyphosphate:nucleotide phosphotransferase, PPK2 family [Jiangella alba]
MTQPTWSSLLRLPSGPVDLSALDPRATPGFDGRKADGQAALQELGPVISDLQERLFAAGRSGGVERLLLVLQGMDTSGKGGTMRHAVGLMDPQGVSIRAFKAPTPDERRRGFLWRIRQALPDAGQVGVFDRSHYEDVLAARVRKLARPAVVESRYDAINDFEGELAASGCVVVKVMLHISAGEQRDRLAERLENPAKYWKYNPGDIDDRKLWPDFQQAYELALERCNTGAAPWHVVPADRKWYRNLAVTQLLIEHLQALDLGWPPADFDVEAEKARLAAS